MSAKIDAGLLLNALLSSHWEIFAVGHCNVEPVFRVLKNRMASLTALLELTPLLPFEL